MGRNDALKQALFRKDWVLGYLLAAYLVTFFAFFVALAAVVACLPDDALTLADDGDRSGTRYDGRFLARRPLDAKE